ncbi:hypothetical protein BV898_18302 [Hypsibius exemplaris]|uniref:Barwin domain-containing protein n=1 Tax=Hypsibius exemplaris TaxID=2072580 RepID=A0A9X6RN09_HYPEX|nr:hypothetical protein BV898_18302 [Hypsibius exemplaris]
MLLTSLLVAVSCVALIGAQTFTGDATYTTPGLGACEVNSRASDIVIAMNREQFGSPARGRDSVWCNKCVKVTATKFGTSVTARVLDRSSGKKGQLVLSENAFKQLASTDEGRIAISWKQVPC